MSEFEIVGFVGEGGFSIVYLARDHSLQRTVAIKEYLPGTLASRQGDNTVAVRSEHNRKTFETGLASFINEARLLAQFDHPALVRVHRFWEANGTAYMAMPYYQGKTLKQLVAERPDGFTEVGLKELFGPILAALGVLHEHNCYHRDVSPDNILVQPGGAAVLLDFGAARRTIADSTQAFTVILKPGFAPVEQYAADGDLKQGPWTDVYAVAAVLYTAIVRKPPPSSVGRVINDSCEKLASRDYAGISRTFLDAIDRGLAVRPEQRPQSIAEFRALLGIEAVPATSPNSHLAPGHGTDQIDKAPGPYVTPIHSGGEFSATNDQATVLLNAGRSRAPSRVPEVRTSGRRAILLRKGGAIGVFAALVLAGAATWVYYGNSDPPGAENVPRVAPPPASLPSAPAQVMPSERAADGTQPAAPSAPQVQPPEVRTTKDSPVPSSRPLPAEKAATESRGAGAASRRAQEERAPGARARPDADRASAKTGPTPGPSKVQCRDWQMRVSMGELLTPEERTQFNTRCQL